MYASQVQCNLNFPDTFVQDAHAVIPDKRNSPELIALIWGKPKNMLGAVSGLHEIIMSECIELLRYFALAHDLYCHLQCMPAKYSATSLIQTPLSKAPTL